MLFRLYPINTRYVEYSTEVEVEVEFEIESNLDDRDGDYTTLLLVQYCSPDAILCLAVQWSSKKYSCENRVVSHSRRCRCSTVISRSHCIAIVHPISGQTTIRQLIPARQGIDGYMDGSIDSMLSCGFYMTDTPQLSCLLASREE